MFIIMFYNYNLLVEKLQNENLRMCIYNVYKWRKMAAWNEF